MADWLLQQLDGVEDPRMREALVTYFITSSATSSGGLADALGSVLGSGVTVVGIGWLDEPVSGPGGSSSSIPSTGRDLLS